MWFFSEQGLDDFCGGCDAAALTLAQKQLGNWCAVTRGAKSVLCFDGTRFTEVPTFPTEAKNTLGAGDVWHGAFTLALANQLSETQGGPLGKCRRIVEGEASDLR